MVLDTSKKKAVQKKAASVTKRGVKTTVAAASSNGAATENGVDRGFDGVSAFLIFYQTRTSVLCSYPLSRDIHIVSLSMTFRGHDLIADSVWKLNYGSHYGLLGLDGCGKSTLVAAIDLHEFPIPQQMDIYRLTREIEASDMRALEAVISCDEERGFSWLGGT
ncbi:ABC transporter F family member 1-like [Durio zibethinus]|uniref:ABC transporter F family member 1-like n=1 Tax=Durio zibethinus TaxID=66656 RepID=A0A6P5Z5U1_DURZI|nr:ABC transporter F family member 1-like [Durio zibethinus]